MEVKPVVAVVTQKLADTLSEDSIADNKVMIHQLKGVQRSLLKLKSFSNQRDVYGSQKSKDHLRVLYQVEDEIEKFTFQVAGQRKRFGFLMKQTFFFNNLNSCRRLKRKIKKIQSNILSSPEDASISSVCTLSLRSLSNYDEGDNDDEDDDGEDFSHGGNELPQKSSSAVWPLSEIPTTPRSPKRALARSFSTIPHHQEHMQQRKKLTFSYSYKENEMSIVGFNIQYPKQVSSFCYQEEELGVYGLSDDIKSLVRRLTHQTDMLVPIVGEEGSGKTTLARAVYKNRKVKDHFEFHDWMSVTEEYTADRILSGLKKITETVKGRRYLIVVDGVGSYGVIHELKDKLPDEKKGSKVIFTSRRISEMKKLNPHVMNGLNEDESWKMFLNKAGKEKEADQIGKLKHKILSICNGLPQNIILMAGLLSNNRIQRWSAVIGDGQCPDDVLSICYNNLRRRSKLRLLYLALFPKDYDIPVRRLLRLWLAEGFVKRKLEDRFPEGEVQKCFEKLVGRNMIQITKLRSDNSPRRCRLVSLFHDYLLPKAQEISLFYIQRNSENFEDAAGPFGVRRMVQHTSNTGVVAHQQTQDQVPVDPSILRSYVSFNFQPKDMPERQVGMVLGRVIRSNFALLRVLDLEGVCQTTLPDKLGHLRHLRYLGLRWTFLENLPESVGDLSYLETLDVKHTRVDSLPDSIWRLKRLRHLNLNNIRLSMPPKSSSSLVTLWGLVLDEKISINEGLGKLRNLRELGIKFSLEKSQNVLFDWIVQLVNLQSLRLTSVNGMGQPSNLALKPLTSLKNLSHLNLYGQLEKLPAVEEFPPTVKVLTLSISRLDKDPMETLEQLPCLIVLRLLGESFTGTRMVCGRRGFKKLEVLKLWVLKDLEEWDVEEEAMERLKEVEIRSCHKLSNISCRILQKQRCLEELVLTDMPDEFVAGIKKRKSKYTSLTIKSSN
ncbi:putative P-loop containing nucleoside triphosphate hydrolase, leucine-rich repeat domain superfamily [Helianthus annuus]|nr:putative P-loop containing nucleoside triphosphate hydrolase, leucine-rich repeat domain superfamily [Helianthus annuus]